MTSGGGRPPAPEAATAGIAAATARRPAVRSGRHRCLVVEFVAIYLAVPVAAAIWLPPDLVFAMLFGLTAVALVLLARTPGFAWSEIWSGWRAIDPLRVALVAGLTLLAAWTLVWVIRPGTAFSLMRYNPGLMLMIVVLYPPLSALPQEIVYRLLYFRRYAPILPAGRTGTGLNAFVFMLAHLMYWNWIAAAMTFAGGILFADAYLRRGFPTVLVMHALAGLIIFAVGLGRYFYSGIVVRPF